MGFVVDFTKGSLVSLNEWCYVFHGRYNMFTIEMKQGFINAGSFFFSFFQVPARLKNRLAMCRTNL